MPKYKFMRDLWRKFSGTVLKATVLFLLDIITLAIYGHGSCCRLSLRYLAERICCCHCELSKNILLNQAPQVGACIVACDEKTQYDDCSWSYATIFRDCSAVHASLVKRRPLPAWKIPARRQPCPRKKKKCSETLRRKMAHRRGTSLSAHIYAPSVSVGCAVFCSEEFTSPP